MNKQILYIDMDGVVADFDKAINEFQKSMDLKTNQFEDRGEMVDHICLAHPYIFLTLEPIEGAIESVTKLADLYDLYFLSTPMHLVTESYTDKRLWLDKHFGQIAHKRLILTHRKDLNIGHFLVDDRLKNGAENFKGIHIHFGQNPFNNWDKTFTYLSKFANVNEFFRNEQ